MKQSFLKLALLCSLLATTVQASIQIAHHLESLELQTQGPETQQAPERVINFLSKRGSLEGLTIKTIDRLDVLLKRCIALNKNSERLAPLSAWLNRTTTALEKHRIHFEDIVTITTWPQKMTVALDGEKLILHENPATPERFIIRSPFGKAGPVTGSDFFMLKPLIAAKMVNLQSVTRRGSTTHYLTEKALANPAYRTCIFSVVSDHKPQFLYTSYPCSLAHQGQQEFVGTHANNLVVQKSTEDTRTLFVLNKNKHS